jgi:hypothetical protein
MKPINVLHALLYRLADAGVRTAWPSEADEIVALEGIKRLQARGFDFCDEQIVTDVAFCLHGEPDPGLGRVLDNCTLEQQE